MSLGGCASAEATVSQRRPALARAIDGAPVDFTIGADGKMFVTGCFEGAADFGGGPLASAGGQDVFVAEYDAAGRHLWSRRFGGGGDDCGFAVSLDAAGSVSIAGRFGHTIDFGGGSMRSAGEVDVFVATFDASSGAHRWSRRFGNAVRLQGGSQYSGDWLRAMAVDGQGRRVLVGSLAGQVDFGGALVGASGASGGFLVALSATGSHLWSRRLRDEISRVEDVRVDGKGMVFVVGEQEHLDGSPDVLAAYSPSGALEWFKPLAVGNGYGRRLLLHPDGTILVGGNYYHPLLNPGAVSGPTDDAVVVAKYARDGTRMWARVLSRAGFAGLTVDAAGDLVVAGTFAERLDLGTSVLASSGGRDIFVVTLANADGSVLRARRLGGSGDDAAWAVKADPRGNVLLLGRFEYAMGFDAGTVLHAREFSPFLASIRTDGSSVRVLRVQHSDGGRVAAIQAGLDCGRSCTADLPRGAAVNLRATPVRGWRFDGWSRDCSGAGGCRLTMNANKTVSARFIPVRGQVRWSRRLGGDDTEQVRGIAATAGGDIVLVGHFDRTTELGGSPIEDPGAFTMFAARYSKSGRHLWSRALNEGAAGQAVAAATRANGNVVVAGTAYGTQGPGFPSAEPDIYLAELSGGDGEVLWSTTSEETHGEVEALALAADGDVVLTGRIAVAKDPSSSTGAEAFVSRYSPAGLLRWTTRFGGPGDRGGQGVVVDPQGDVFVAGWFEDRIDFGGGASLQASGEDVFLTRLAGTVPRVLWSKRVGGPGPDDAMDLGLDGAGNPTLLACMRSAGRLYISGGGCEEDSSTLLARFSPRGETLWSRNLSAPCHRRSARMAPLPGGDVVVTGEFGDRIDLGGGEIAVAGGCQSSHSGVASDDVYVARFAGVDGSNVWARRFGGLAYDGGSHVATHGSDVTVAAIFGRPDWGGVSRAVRPVLPPYGADFGTGSLGLRGDLDIVLLRLGP